MITAMYKRDLVEVNQAARNIPDHFHITIMHSKSYRRINDVYIVSGKQIKNVQDIKHLKDRV
jgi:hypothetical protein